MDFTALLYGNRMQAIPKHLNPFYLDMIKHTSINDNNWNMKYPQGLPFEDKHLKIDVIENIVQKNNMNNILNLNFLIFEMILNI